MDSGKSRCIQCIDRTRRKNSAREGIVHDTAINTSMLQAATAPEQNSWRSISFLFSERTACAFCDERQALLRATTTEHRVTGGETGQSEKPVATDSHYSGRFAEHYRQRVKNGSWCVMGLITCNFLRRFGSDVFLAPLSRISSGIRPGYFTQGSRANKKHVRDDEAWQNGDRLQRSGICDYRLPVR